MALSYTDDNRGKIQFRDRARQIVDFNGIRFNNITPTDIDGMIEYKNKCFIFIEIKSSGTDMPYGQKLAFERLIDNIEKPSILIISTHVVDDYNLDIIAKETVVRKCYTKDKKWFDYNGTLYEVIEKYIKSIEV